MKATANLLNHFGLVKLLLNSLKKRSISNTVIHILIIFRFFVHISSRDYINCYCKTSVLSIGQGWCSGWVPFAINRHVISLRHKGPSIHVHVASFFLPSHLSLKHVTV